MRWPRFASASGACIILLSALPIIADEPMAYHDQLRFADGLFSRRMYTLAIPEYEQLLEQYPDGEQNDTAIFRLAESLRLDGEAQTAARWYDRLVATFPQSDYRLRAAYRRARLYMEAGDNASAVAHFRAVLGEHPDPDVTAASLYYLAETLLNLEQTAEAETVFEQLLEQFPKSQFAAYAHMHQAALARDRWVAARRAEDTDAAAQASQEALARYDAVLKMDAPDRLSAEALFRSADIHFAEGNYTASAAAYRRLLEIYPNDQRASEARLQAAWAAANAGLHAEALKLAAPMTEATTGNERAEWLYLKANCERQLLQYDRAVATYRQLINDEPSSSRHNRARYELALSLYKLEDYAAAIREAGAAADIADLQADAAWLLAESHAALNQADQAIQYYRLVLRIAPDSPLARDAIYRLAYQLQSQGQLREAARFYAMLADRFPEASLAGQALFAAGIALEQAGDDTGSAREWGRLVDNYADNRFAEEARFRRALSMIRAGRESEGGDALDQYLSRHPEGRFLADVYYWRGVLLSQADRYRDAMPMLQRALTLSPRLDLEREILLQLGTVQQRLGDDDAAARSFGNLLGTEAEGRLEPSLLEWLATYHAAKEQRERALQAAGALAAREGDPAWHQAGLTLQGRIHLYQGNASEAERLLQQALNVEARTRYGAEAALLLGNMMIDAKRSSEADTLYREAARRAASEDALDIRVQALFGLGRSAAAVDNTLEAARHFMSVAILFDDNRIVPESLHRAAIMFDRAGREAEAQAARNELAARYPDSEFNKPEAGGEPSS